ncbi:TPA: hypothetical protein ACGVBQ_000340 [Vibrio vulnificus]
MHKMFKTTALFGSLSILFGCGGGSGSDSSGQPSQPSREVIAMDGFLKNAVVFEDANNNLRWDENEPLLGLTNEFGKLKINTPKDSQIGVMTINAHSELANKLAAIDDRYQGIETIDMDIPDKAMGKEVVFVAPKGVNILSPFSHLVSSIAFSEQIDASEAQQKLETELNTHGFELNTLGNYLESGSKAQHKLAQLFTDSFGTHQHKVSELWPGFVEESVFAVNQLSDVQLADPTMRPSVDGDMNTPVQFNHKLVRNKSAIAQLYTVWSQMSDISLGDTGEFFRIDLSALEVNGQPTPMLTDPDVKEGKVTYLVQNHYSAPLSTSTTLVNGVTVSIDHDGSSLVLSSERIQQVGTVPVMLHAVDRDQNGEIVQYQVFLLEVRTSSANKAPYVVANAQENLQATVDSDWIVQKGQEFNYNINVADLFADVENDSLNIDVSGSALDIGLNGVTKDGVITISGTPVKSYQEDHTRHTLTISATDNFNSRQASVTLTLPEIWHGELNQTNPLIGKNWYYIDSVEEDGQVKNYCRFINFSNGKVTQTLANVYDYHGCQQASQSVIQSTFYTETTLTSLKERLLFNTKIYTMRYRQKVQSGEAYAVSIDLYEGAKNKRVFMFYSDINEVKQRLDLDSVNANDSATFHWTLPLEDRLVSATIRSAVSDQTIELTFIPPKGITLTCEDLRNLWVISGGLYGISNSSWGSRECTEVLESDNIYPQFTFSLSRGDNLANGESYSVNVDVNRKSTFDYIEPLKFNLKKD